MSVIQQRETLERDEFLSDVIAELRDGNARWPGLWTRLASLMAERDDLAVRLEAQQHINLQLIQERDRARGELARQQQTTIGEGRAE